MLDPSAKSYNTHLSFPNIPNDRSDSGVYSPTLWITSPPKSPPHHRPEDYWRLSPDSKAQAIARGQRELMQMVSKMPESCYELSLTDIVEVRGNEESDRKVFDELPKRTARPSKVVRKTKSGKRVDPNRNSGVVINSGSLLKMLFPFILGSKKDTKKNKKKKKGKDFATTIKDSQVSPRPSISDDLNSEERDWWNRLSESRGNANTKRIGSSNSNSNSSNKSRNSTRDKKGSCLSFLWSVRSRE